jgi:putative membrane-bound dehydrogenase-like protein
MNVSVIRLGLLMVLLSISFLVAQSPSPAEPFDLAKHIKLPSGFMIEKMAGPPLVQHPMHVSFDDKMRLYVTEAAGVNRNAQQLEKELPNCIKRLTDTVGNGKYDQATIFADKLTFPGGVMFHQGAVYATAFPYLWKFVDKDDDGVAEERIPVIGKFGSVGNGADLHGPQLGPDGWLYFCDGRNGHDLTYADGTKDKGRAAGLYRCKADGSGLERVFAGGMDNPVEVAFTPAGEPLACTNLVLNNPRHDAILYGIEGGVYPYDLRAVKELKWTGGYLPMMDLGWVAVSSIMRYDHYAWGKEWDNKYFTAEFNTHRVRQHTIERDGAGFKITSSADFLTCSHSDFHPTQISQAPDGSMILVDTGGWFRNGCPQSQIAKPEVMGGIYRIYKAGHGVSKEPEPAPALSDPFVLFQPSCKAIWQRGYSEAAWTDAVRRAISDVNIDVAVCAIRSAGLRRDEPSFASILKALNRREPAVRREAATTLGRLKKPEAVPALVKALEQADDPFLEHALIYALISIKDPQETAEGLAFTSLRVLRGVLLALDQMESSNLSWDQVAPLLQMDDLRLKQTALEIVGRRPAWVVELADYLDRELNKKQIDASRLVGCKNLLLALAKEAPVQQLIADRLTCPETPATLRFMLLEVLAEADIRPWPKIWIGPLQAMLAESKTDDETLSQSLQAAASSQLRAFDPVLRRIAEDNESSPSIRLSAAAIALQDGQPVPTLLFDFLARSCKSNQEPMLRLTAARALSYAALNETQLIALTDIIRRAGPLEMPLLLNAFEHQPTETALRTLVTALSNAPGFTAVTPDRLNKLFSRIPSDLKPQTDTLLKRLSLDANTSRARLQQLKPTLSGGDPKAGRELFFGSKAICSTCHRIKDQGGLIGPNLSQIGAIRSREDLLESIVFPSASIARGYETLVVVTKDGKTTTGVLTRETPNALILTNTQRLEQKVLRNEIEGMTTSPTSIMPYGMDQTLSVDELRNLLAYLESLRN